MRLTKLCPVCIAVNQIALIVQWLSSDKCKCIGLTLDANP